MKDSLPVLRSTESILLFLFWIVVTASSVYCFDTSEINDSISENKLQKVKKEFQRGGIEADTLDVSGIAERAGSDSVSLVGISIRIIISLIIIILVLYILMYFFKKSNTPGSFSGGGSMDLIETISTGPGSSMVLVRILDSVYVLGQTTKGMHYIDKIEGEKAVEAIAMTKAGADITGFKEVFSNFMTKVKNGGGGNNKQS